MKTSPLATICGTALAAMAAAGISHWWSVKEFVAIMQAAPALAVDTPRPTILSAPQKSPSATFQPLARAHSKPLPANSPDPSQKKFYESLLSRMESLQNQNRDLLDQVAETNRDVMKLEFRVDTHSESFRPMPVVEERIDTSFENGPGVLPPRAEPVFLPTDQ